MGWSFGWGSRQELKTYLSSPERLGGAKILAQSDKRSVLWTVIEVPDYVGAPTAKRFILADLIKGEGPRDGNNWGYKDLDESMGPCELTCPVRFFDLVPDPGSYATEWRAKVRAYAAKQSVKYQVGDVLGLVNTARPLVVRVTSVRPFLGEDLATGLIYRIPKRMVGEKVSA